MKKIVNDAVWCLAISSILSLLLFLFNIQSKSHFVNDKDFLSDSSNQIYILFNLLNMIIRFSGEIAFVIYIIENSNLKSAKYSLLLLFISNCLMLWSSAIRSLIHLSTNDASLLFLKHSTIIPIDIVGPLTGIMGYLLLLYSTYKSNLFPQWVVTVFITAYLFEVSLFPLQLIGAPHILSKGILVLGILLMILSSYALAKNVNSSNRSSIN